MSVVVAIPIVIFAVLVLILAVRSVKYGGVTGAIFKARISRTVGSVTVVNSDSPQLRVKVHLLEKSDTGWVGLEFERFNGESWEIKPLLLSKLEAGQIAALLSEAAQAA